MKNKITLFFLVISLSMPATSIFAVWDDIFSWAKHRTFEVPIASNILHENNETDTATIIEKPKEKQEVQKSVASDKVENKKNWNPKKVAVIAGILTLTCFFNVKAMLGIIVLAYLIRQNAGYIDKSGVGKIIDGFVEKGIQVIKEIL